MALVVALCSIPLLLLDDGSSADGETVGAAPAPVPSTVASVAPVAADAPQPTTAPSSDLVSRSRQWRSARTALIESNTERALDIAEQASDLAATEAGETVTAAPAPEAATEVADPAPEPAPVVTTTAAPSTTVPPPPTTTAAPPPPPPPPPPPAQAGEPSPAQWEALRQCESGGNYNAISPNGLYRGAYQFSRATWDGVAASHYPHLVGVDPATAAPADQDAMALALWRMSGHGPWPHCGVHLT